MAEFTKEEKQICLAVMRGLMAEEPEIDAGYINRAVFANAHEAKKQRLPIEAEPIRRTVRTFIQARKRKASSLVFPHTLASRMTRSAEALEANPT
jgi:hypothetical protein